MWKCCLKILDSGLARACCSTSRDCKTITMGCFSSLLLLALVCLFSNATVAQHHDGNCYWSGTAPFCRGRCPRGFVTVRSHRDGGGRRCWGSWKRLCCPGRTIRTESFVSLAQRTDKRGMCHWSGTAPFCNGRCPSGQVSMFTSANGEGRRCWSGWKHYCCPQRARLSSRSSTDFSFDDFTSSSSPREERWGRTLTRRNCFWSGTAPFCRSRCPVGFTTAAMDRRGNGKRCWSGFKRHCCPTSPLAATRRCFWSGTAPYCRGSCPRGHVAVTRDRSGDGRTCTSGSKAFCCPA